MKPWSQTLQHDIVDRFCYKNKIICLKTSKEMLPWQDFLYGTHLSYMWLARFTRQYVNP